ncbi:MAG: hypothetical protein ACFFDX_16245 [Candidatus Odinarchaeota archaeon]
MKDKRNILNPSLKELLIVYATGIIITIFSAIFFSIRGYPLVNTATETLNIATPPLYMISIFFPYGILIGEVIWIWNEKQERDICFLLLLECISVAILAFMRFIIAIPFSGHAIILFFYLPHQLVNNKTQYPLRFIIGLVVLIITIIYKIFLWNDPITFILGAILGVFLWIPGFLYRLKKV